MFDFIPLRLTFHGDVGALKPEESLSKTKKEKQMDLIQNTSI